MQSLLRTAPRLRYAALGIAFAILVQLAPHAPLQPASAAEMGMPTAVKFGASGTRSWTVDDISVTDAGMGACACSPSIGVDWMHGDGRAALYQAGIQTFCLTWAASSPAAAPMLTAADCTSGFNQRGTQMDAVLHTDFDGGRTYAGSFFPFGAGPVASGCTDLSFTDTADGSDGWYPSVEACALPGYEHASVGAGPWAFPPPAWAAPGSRAAYLCAKAFVSASPAPVTITGIQCWQSYDGGVTFTPMDGDKDASGGQCNALSGRMRVGRMYLGDDVGEGPTDEPDGMGVVFLPNKACEPGTGSSPNLAPTTCQADMPPASCITSFLYSRDNALSWKVAQRPPAGPPAPCSGAGDVAPSLQSGHLDPAVGVSLSNDWVYLGQGERGIGAGMPGGAFVGLSKTMGGSWEVVGTGSGACPGTQYFNVGSLVGVQQAALPAIVAGDDGRAAFAFLGSPTADDYDSCFGPSLMHVWHLYVAFTYDAGKSWSVDQVSQDPVHRGGISPHGGDDLCHNLGEFIDITMDVEGRVIVAYTDGCTGTCTGPGGTAFMSLGTDAMVARQWKGRGLLSAYDIPDPPPAPLGDTASGPEAPGPTQPGRPEPGVTDTEDRDHDGIYDVSDNCRTTANPDQANADTDVDGDACDGDDDADGVIDGADLCPTVFDPRQLDWDRDGKGDACDLDADGDSILNAADNCWTSPNGDQKDGDGDGAGDLCDADRDGDGVPNGLDGRNGRFADDATRWTEDTAEAVAPPRARGEDVRPMMGVETAAEATAGSTGIMVMAAAVVFVALAATATIAFLRRR